MIIDCRKWRGKEDADRERCIVHVDGQEIRGVFYVDTDAGLVKTYDVFGDGRTYTGDLTSNRAWAGFPTFYEANVGYLNMINAKRIGRVPLDEYRFGDRCEILSRTVRGKVTTFPIP